MMGEKNGEKNRDISAGTDFLNAEKPLLTVMIQTDIPERATEIIQKSLRSGADAFGLQVCRLKPEYRNESAYREIFAQMQGKPVYVTNYRLGFNEGKDDETLALELLELAKSGASLCDVMGDYYDQQPDQVAVDPCAIEKQKVLIKELHKSGAKVLISSHVCKFIPAERVLEIALQQQACGADIVKIVTGADTMEEQIENLRITWMLKEKLDVPFLFVTGGMSSIHRRIGPMLGCCMYLCVYEHDEMSTPMQPLLRDAKLLRDALGFEQ